MNKLVVHHYYSRSAFDLSDNRNHGRPISVTQSSGPDAAFVFAKPESEVLIEPSPSLQDLWSIRALVNFQLSPGGGINRRFNLIEGHLSFALFVENDGSLMGTILDRDENWIGTRSAPNLISKDQWYTAELLHDGCNAIELYLDGVQVAGAYNAPGQVRSIGPKGITVGHWPETSGRYTFTGHIREVKLFKYDPYKDANGLLNPCCQDRKALDAAVQKLRENGATAESLAAKGREILQFGLDFMGKVRGADAAATAQQRQFSTAALTAYLRGDQASFTSAQARLALLTQQRLTQDQMKASNEQMEKLIANLPLPFDELQDLLSVLCLDKPTIDPEALVSEINRLKR